jgi:hypothetical protein
MSGDASRSALDGPSLVENKAEAKLESKLREWADEP